MFQNFSAVENIATDGGAVYIAKKTHIPNFDQINIQGNTARRMGGGFFVNTVEYLKPWMSNGFFTRK